MQTKKINDVPVELLLPWDELEETAQKQIEGICQKPDVIGMAIMPDCHSGYDMPIGGVAVTLGTIYPNWVGFDIGCGMCYVQTTLEHSDILRPQELNEKIKEKIPVGFNQHSGRAQGSFMSASGDKTLTTKVQQKQNAQLGTLGGGNHFIELGFNDKGHVGIVIHSGSRRPGWEIADFYMKKAEGQGFEVNSELGQAYIKDMSWAENYALENRKVMMKTVLDILGIPMVNSFNIHNENHNHAIVQKGIYPNTVLHRKGATPAEKDQIGMIPGNMRDGTIITRGLGNEKYLCSASHGAGRVMSRTKAKKTLDYLEMCAEMAVVGIYGDLTKSMLDEAPQAYKNLDTVISRQEGVVIEVIDRVKPFLVIKG